MLDSKLDVRWKSAGGKTIRTYRAQKPGKGAGGQTPGLLNRPQSRPTCAPDHSQTCRPPQLGSTWEWTGRNQGILARTHLRADLPHRAWRPNKTHLRADLPTPTCQATWALRSTRQIGDLNNHDFEPPLHPIKTHLQARTQHRAVMSETQNRQETPHDALPARNKFARCSARNRRFLSPSAPIILQFGADLRHRRFWRENKIAPSPHSGARGDLKFAYPPSLLLH